MIIITVASYCNLKILYNKPNYLIIFNNEKLLIINN